MSTSASRQFSNRRAPLRDRSAKGDKAARGRTPTAETVLNLRTHGLSVDPETRQHVRARLGRQLGKHALHIERVTARFEDINGPRGGVDTVCRIKVVISGRPSVVVEEHGADARIAFDQAAKVAERTVTKALGKAGLSEPGKRAQRASRPRVGRDQGSARSARAAANGSHIGRRVGRNDDNLLAAAERPEKARRDTPIDTAKVDRSATDRRAGAGATAARNTRLNDAGLSYALEDSMQDRPSRKSTRRSTNSIKPDSNLRRRQTRAITSPKARAARASVQR